MNTGNWKTAIKSRDKKRSNKSSKDRSQQKDSETRSSTQNLETRSVDSDKRDPDSSSPEEESGVMKPKKILTRQKDVVEKPPEIPDTSAVEMKKPDASLSEAAVKPTWADISESADVSLTLRTFNEDFTNKCATLKEQLSFVASAVTAVLNIGAQAIRAERVRIGETKNEKSIVQNLHEICVNGRELVTITSDGMKNISSIVDMYEVEKNNALDELKNFLATLGVTETAKPQLAQSAQSASVAIAKPKISDVPKRILADVRYASVVSADAARVPGNVDMASIPLQLGNLIVPLARNRSDIQPMGIKFASDLGVFLINIDGRMYSFCNGTFISRTPKSGDNTLFGKRCNPGIARCVGADCTYYHDPLTHSNGHTNRNMGVHYVVSELINGVASEKEIIETARGKNRYIVEDIIQLAGMLLIKAFLVKKARDNAGHRDRDEF
jgi:hypothetical protein